MASKNILPNLLLDWFKESRRSFPWRSRTDPYEVLIAEIMLQRTRAEQVAPVYEEFLAEFPTVRDLYRAGLPRIRRYFKRLGIFWRATLVKRMAKDIVVRLSGNVPSDRDELLSIPAVGNYVADAVLVFAHGKNVAVVDSNVIRLIMRVYGLKQEKEARRKPIFKEILAKILPERKAREFNWAMIDLAALLCTSRNPCCPNCPLKEICEYYVKSL